MYEQCKEIVRKFITEGFEEEIAVYGKILEMKEQTIKNYIRQSLENNHQPVSKEEYKVVEIFNQRVKYYSQKYAPLLTDKIIRNIIYESCQPKIR